ERRHNPALRYTSLESFVDATVASIGDRPPHVDHIVALNRGPLIEDLGAPTPLTPRAVEVAIAGGAILGDAWTNEQFDEAHIPGSVHVPYGELIERLGELPRDRTIAAVCSGGKRSGLAASLLQREGFERVVHVGHGGVGTWRARGHPVETVESAGP